MAIGSNYPLDRVSLQKRRAKITSSVDESQMPRAMAPQRPEQKQAKAKEQP